MSGISKNASVVLGKRDVKARTEDRPARYRDNGFGRGVCSYRTRTNYRIRELINRHRQTRDHHIRTTRNGNDLCRRFRADLQTQFRKIRPIVRVSPVRGGAENVAARSREATETSFSFDLARNIVRRGKKHARARVCKLLRRTKADRARTCGGKV